VDKEILSTLIVLVLGGGLAASFTTFIKGWITLRSGARAREHEVLANLREDLRETREELRWAEADRDYWRGTTAGAHWQLRQAGIQPKPAEPIPPSERED
jgi:hypothetical protein